MRYLQLCSVVCAVCLTASLGVSGDARGEKAAGGKPVTVAMKSLSYEPKLLEIQVGDSVVWSNDAHTAHTATSDDDSNAIDSGEIQPGKSSKAVAFNKAGEFKYHCEIHGRAMSGTIIVKGG